MNVSKRGRAAGVGAAVVALFCGLAAVGLAAGTTLSAGPSSPSLPQALAPPHSPALSLSALAPDSPRTVPLTSGDRVTFTVRSGWGAGRPGCCAGPPAGHDHRRCHRHRHLNGTRRAGGHLPKSRGVPLAS